MGVTIQQVEEALGALWAGKSIVVKGVSKSVAVFIDVPDPEEYTARTFPSISVIYSDIEEEVMENEEEYLESIDTSKIPHIATMHPAQKWYWLEFNVSTYVRGDAAADRALQLYMATHTRGKDSILVGTAPVGGAPDTRTRHWLFCKGHVVRDDASQPESVVYWKIWTFAVLVDLEDETAKTDTPLIHEIQAKMYTIRQRRKLVYDEGTARNVWLPVDNLGNVVEAEDAVKTLDRTIEIP